LLVVYRRIAHTPALRIHSTRSNRPAHAVRSDNDAATTGGFTIFFDLETQGMRIDFGHRPGIGIGIAGDRVVFAVILACPLIMDRVAVVPDSINRNFDAVSCSLVDNTGVLCGPGSELRFGFVQLPGSDVRVIRDAHSYSHQAQG
jgi:hypothetical protein